MTTPVKAERLVVMNDGGSGSRAALRWVAHHLSARPARVDLVSVAEDDAQLPAASEALAAAGLVLRTLTDDAIIETSVLRGDPAIAPLAAADGADLVVVGAAVGGGLLTAPRVPSRVAAHATGPVVVVPGDWHPVDGPVVVGVSIDSASEGAVEYAAELAHHQGRDLVLAHAWDLPTVGAMPLVSGGGESIPERQRDALERTAAAVRAHHPGLTVSVDLRHGPAAASLAAAAGTASVLVIGRRRRSDLARRVLGSVSAAVVSDPPCAVIVVPGPAAGIAVLPEILAEDL